MGLQQHHPKTTNHAPRKSDRLVFKPRPRRTLLRHAVPKEWAGSWTSFKKMRWQQSLHSFISYIFHPWYRSRNRINDAQNSTWFEDCRKQLLQNVFIAAPGRDIQLTESYRSTAPITVASHLLCLFIKGGEKGGIPFSHYNKFCVAPKVLSPIERTWWNILTSNSPLTQLPSLQKRANRMMPCGSENTA